jgi:hypothetical protein
VAEADAEADVIRRKRDRLCVGTSLWRDAWRRLLKNKLAVFGLIVVSLLRSLRSLDRP